jgi:hypothetical protein
MRRNTSCAAATHSQTATRSLLNHQRHTYVLNQRLSTVSCCCRCCNAARRCHPKGQQRAHDQHSGNAAAQQPTPTDLRLPVCCTPRCNQLGCNMPPLAYIICKLPFHYALVPYTQQQQGTTRTSHFKSRSLPQSRSFTRTEQGPLRVRCKVLYPHTMQGPFLYSL